MQWIKGAGLAQVDSAARQLFEGLGWRLGICEYCCQDLDCILAKPQERKKAKPNPTLAAASRKTSRSSLALSGFKFGKRIFSFHMSLGPLYVFLGEVYVQVLCPFFNWVVCLPGVESCEFIYFAQIPYNLTFNWNIINKRKKQTKYNQRH